jgi:hypothetical protein
MLVLSAFAHSLAGGAQLRSELAAAAVPADLFQGVMIGWYFGGAAMFAFGLVVGHAFLGAEPAGSTVPALLIGTVYLVFGFCALALSSLDPFFLVFVVPGLLVVAASLMDRRPR